MSVEPEICSDEIVLREYRHNLAPKGNILFLVRRSRQRTQPNGDSMSHDMADLILTAVKMTILVIELLIIFR